jgi:hypothetical protein
MRIVDERTTGIYKLIEPLEKAGFSCSIVTSTGCEYWAHVYLKRKWFWGLLSYYAMIGNLWPKYSSYGETHLDVEYHHDEVVKVLATIPEYKDILIKLKGQKYVGGTKVA